MLTTRRAALAATALSALVALTGCGLGGQGGNVPVTLADAQKLATTLSAGINAAAPSLRVTLAPMDQDKLDAALATMNASTKALNDITTSTSPNWLALAQDAVNGIVAVSPFVLPLLPPTISVPAAGVIAVLKAFLAAVPVPPAMLVPPASLSAPAVRASLIRAGMLAPPRN